MALAATACTGAAVAGCSRQPEPPRFPAEFVLVNSSAGALPAPVQRDSGCIIFLGAGDMVLTDADSYTSEFRMMRACAGTTTDLPSPGTSGRYSLTGDSVRFWNAQGNPSGRGVLRGDSLIVTGPTHTLMYLRTDR